MNTRRLLFATALFAACASLATVSAQKIDDGNLQKGETQKGGDLKGDSSGKQKGGDGAKKDGDRRKEKRHELDISGKCQTTFLVAGQPAPNALEFVVDGTCEVTHLGHATVHIDQVATFNLDGTSESVATLTYNFGHGNVLYETSHGHATAPDANLVFLFHATEQIVGGTGRFADAEGWTKTTGVARILTGTAHYAFHGEIEY